MSKEVIISEETLKMLISMAYQEGYKAAYQTLYNLNVDTLSNKVADKIVESLEPIKPKKDE